MPLPVFLFAPGAGAPSSHAWMQRWAGLLEPIGQVHLLDYPYMIEHRGRPDPLPKLIAAHRAALEKVRAGHQGSPIVLIGKSMGSRVGCHVALVEKVSSVVCIGYPLCGGGDPAKLRDQVLKEIKTPILLVQGTRDSLCPLKLLSVVRGEMKAENELEVVPGGDHSLAVTKRQLKSSGETQVQVESRIVHVIANFVARHSDDRSRARPSGAADLVGP